jgi:hypothetical protein
MYLLAKELSRCFDDVVKFVKTVKLPKLTSVDTIKNVMTDPLAKAKLACFISIAQILEGFLTTFQSNAALAPFLYDDLMEIVKGLMQRCVKPEVIDAATTSSRLIRIDLDDSKNLLSRHKVVLGVSAQAMMAKAKATDLQIMSFQVSCQKFLVAMIKKLLERSPLKYKATKAVSCLNPFTVLHNRSTSEARMGDLLLQLHNLNTISSDVADAAKTQFSTLCANVATAFKDKFKQFTRDEDLSRFYAELLAGNDRYKELWTVVKLVMVLSHGNAAVEGGFSINKDLLIDSLLEETVVAQRVVFDAIRNAAMDVKNIDITAKMVSGVRQSSAAYKASLEVKQKQQTEAQQQVRDDRKRKALISSLEQQKLKLEEMKSQAAELDKHIAELKSPK